MLALCITGFCFAEAGKNMGPLGSRVGADRVGYQDSGNTPEIVRAMRAFLLVFNNCKQFVNYWIEACLCTRIFCPISQNVNICNSAVFSTQGLKFWNWFFFNSALFQTQGWELKNILTLQLLKEASSDLVLPCCKQILIDGRTIFQKKIQAEEFNNFIIGDKIKTET